MTMPDLTTIVRIQVAAMDGERHEIDEDTQLYILTSLEDDARPQAVSLLGAVRAILRREAYWLAFACEAERETMPGSDDWIPDPHLNAMRYIPLPPSALELYHDPSVVR